MAPEAYVARRKKRGGGKIDFIKINMFCVPNDDISKVNKNLLEENIWKSSERGLAFRTYNSYNSIKNTNSPIKN